MRWLPAIGFMAVCGCDYRVFATQVGEHVVYHWDVETWAAEDERLCGGTAAAADQMVAAISTHYGWPLPENGPTIEYFWDRQLARNACSASVSACVTDARVVFTSDPFDTHEIAHTARGGHGHISFVEEGLASRWQSGMIDLGSTYRTSATFLTEAQLREQLELRLPQDRDQLNWQHAMTWLVALETAFGPLAVGEFIDRLDWSSSSKDVERALQDVFGISLAESVTLAENTPEGTVDDPVCEFANLPTWALTDNPDDVVYIDRGEAHCDDHDLLSIHSQRATWLFAIELPPATTSLDVEVTLPAGVEPYRQTVTLVRCNGKVDIESMSFMTFDPGDPKTLLLHGRHVGALIGEVTADGSVELPRVSFRETPQP